MEAFANGLISVVSFLLMEHMANACECLVSVARNVGYMLGKLLVSPKVQGL